MRATSFRYMAPAVRIHAGQDALAHLPDEVRRTGARRAFVVCGQSVAHGTDLLVRVGDALGELYAGEFDRVRAESPLPSVEAGASAARAAGADAIIAVGGGSAVVTARAITILLAEEGTVHDLCTQYPPGKPPVSPRLMKPKLPNFVVLTTPTTATNRAGAAVLDTERRHRLELFDPKTRPAAVILDGDALLTAPPRLYLATATTTFCGVAGALQSPSLNPFAYADLRAALEISLTDMPRLMSRQDDPDLRIRLASAALLANRASDAGAGGAGGVSTGLTHQLQSRYDHIDQGTASAVLTVPGMRFNREVLAAGQARLGRLMGAAGPDDPDLKAAEAAADAVASFLTALGMPARLRDLGVKEEHLPEIAEAAMHDFFLRGNARPVREAAELLALLRETW